MVIEVGTAAVLGVIDGGREMISCHEMIWMTSTQARVASTDTDTDTAKYA
jgi:hypothetical protein